MVPYTKINVMGQYYSDFEKSKIFQMGDYFPIPYSIESENRIKRYLGLETRVRSLYETKDLTPIELTHLNYLSLSIEAFYAQDNSNHLKREKLIPLIMDQAGAKTLKRIRLKSFLESHGDSLIEEPEWWKDTPSYYITDIGEVYNYNYCMFWNAPDEQDYLLSQVPVNTDERMVRKFTRFVNEFISRRDDFEYVQEEEILFRLSSSMAQENGESVPHFSAKSRHMSFSKKRKPGKRCFITTGPGQGRDAIINDIEDLNTIQLINENVRCFLEKNFKHHILTGNVEESKKRYFKRCEKSKGFYCRDFKKEGITKPKWIIKVILSALNKRYPDCSAFHCPDFYDGPWFEGDAGQRGVGLGMANELTTLMQILLFYFTNRELGKQGYYINATSFYALNDDCIVFFDEDFEWAFEDFVDVDFEVCDALGMMASRDKSFFSRLCCVFCELYYSRKSSTMNRKMSYSLREESIILRSSSIIEAKFLLGNLKGSLRQIEDNLLKAYLKLGYEFFTGEIDLPITFGGARSFKLRGTDMSLAMLESVGDIKNIFRAYIANKNRRLWGKKKVENFVHPIMNFYPQLKTVEDVILRKLGIVPDFELSCMFFRPTKEHKFHSSIEKLAKKRQRVFEETTTSPTFETFCELYSTESLSNVWLFPHQIERKIPVRIFTMKDFKDPYKIKNPISSYLNTLVRTKPKIPSTDWGLFQSDATLLHEKSVFARMRTQNTLSLIDRFEEDFETELLVFPLNREDIPDFMEAYPKPFLTSELVTEGNLLGIPYRRFWNPELTRRLSVFGRYLEWHHIKLAQSHTWEELTWILQFEAQHKKWIKFDEEFWISTFELMRSKERQPPPGDDSSTSGEGNTSDDDDNPFNYPLSLNTKNVNVNYDIEQVFIESKNSEEEITSEIFVIEKPPPTETTEERIIREKREKESKNPFMKLHGPLPEGDISVYGSVGWVKWFVREWPLEMQDYLDADDDLDYASYDVMMFKRHLNTSSNIMEERNREFRDNLASSIQHSWISHYFDEYIHEPVEEEEPVEFDLF